MKSFRNIAELIRIKRIEYPKRMSQADLSILLGYKNGQFISNVERGLCSIPPKIIIRVSEVLEIEPEELKTAILKDYDESLSKFIKKPLRDLNKAS